MLSTLTNNKKDLNLVSAVKWNGFAVCCIIGLGLYINAPSISIMKIGAETELKTKIAYKNQKASFIVKIYDNLMNFALFQL